MTWSSGSSARCGRRRSSRRRCGSRRRRAGRARPTGASAGPSGRQKDQGPSLRPDLGLQPADVRDGDGGREAAGLPPRPRGGLRALRRRPPRDRLRQPEVGRARPGLRGLALRVESRSSGTSAAITASGRGLIGPTGPRPRARSSRASSTSSGSCGARSSRASTISTPSSGDGS